MEAKRVDFQKLKSQKRGRTRSRVYVWPESESILDNLQNRRNRPIKLFRQLALDGLASAGVKPENITLKWSQKCGCQCGCSPGFLVEGYDPLLFMNDCHVTV